MTTASPERHRFEVLDSWRGICACLVALYHFHTTSHIWPLGIIQKAGYAVDYFFVLSGFVIFANYERRLKEGFGTVRFMLLRFGRLYPLHLFTLLIFIAGDMAQVFIPSLRHFAHDAPFTGNESLHYIIIDLLLLQGMGVVHEYIFNGPSWSISAEFYTYVLFALAIPWLKNKINWLLAVLLVAAPVLLYEFSPHYLNSTHDFGFIRAVFGFAAGAVVWKAYKCWSSHCTLSSPVIWTVLEVSLILRSLFLCFIFQRVHCL